MTATLTSDHAPQLMLDHPGWITWPEGGYAQRAFRSGDTVWMVSCRRREATFQPVVDVVHQGPVSVDVRPMVDTFDAGTLPAPVRQALKIDATTSIHRVRNPDVWDAMLMPIFRQRIAITDAAKRYRAFCIRYGTVVNTETGTTLLPPRPETVATLDDDPPVVGRRMPVLRAAARTYIRLHLDQAPRPPAVLYDMVLRIHRIGASSAARIVADTTGDFTFYEHAGFGSREYWRQHATELDTSDQELDLSALWKSCTDQQRSTAIALTTHQRLAAPRQTEATDSDALRHLIRDMARSEQRSDTHEPAEPAAGSGGSEPQADNQAGPQLPPGHQRVHSRRTDHAALTGRLQPRE